MGMSNKYGEKSLGKSKIGIVGWYGYKNTGDEAILDSLIRARARCLGFERNRSGKYI